ncbi:SDR family NAD(P)-dependent oxidoreductase [Microbacterium sp. NPDC055910]|uniref:SDR family NAD(P)-dependent oxidoreductase n=1 Tax=Microbacterium sp. NPDC055910 TaxID=3345659 RepID=UPI0035E05733
MTHVLITGGASGIGRSLAHRLAALGHRVSVLDRLTGPDWWLALAADSRGVWVMADVTDTDAVTASIAEAEAIAPLTGLATCAGIVTNDSALDVSREAFTDAIDINVWGALGTAQAFARVLCSAGRPGAIVTVSSTAGLGYVAGLGVAYHASKAALVGVTRSMAGDLAPHGIRVSCVAPGLVRTPMSARERDSLGEELLAARAPAGRLAEPEEIASAIAWLLSPAASLITGHVLPVDGGQTSLAVPLSGGYPAPEVDTRDLSHPMSDTEVYA